MHNMVHDSAVKIHIFRASGIGTQIAILLS